MIDTPQTIQTSAQPTAFIHLKIPKDQIQHAMGPGLQELISTLAAQGVALTGPWFTHHWKITDEAWDFEIAVPVAGGVVASGRLEPGIRPAMKALRTVYHGPYEGLGEAWGEFLDWAEAEGLKLGEDLWECYLAGPETGLDPAKWRTEFMKKIAN